MKRRKASRKGAKLFGIDLGDLIDQCTSTGWSRKWKDCCKSVERRAKSILLPLEIMKGRRIHRGQRRRMKVAVQSHFSVKWAATRCLRLQKVHLKSGRLQYCIYRVDGFLSEKLWAQMAI